MQHGGKSSGTLNVLHSQGSVLDRDSKETQIIKHSQHYSILFFFIFSLPCRFVCDERSYHLHGDES